VFQFHEEHRQAKVSAEERTRMGAGWDDCGKAGSQRAFGEPLRMPGPIGVASIATENKQAVRATGKPATEVGVDVAVEQSRAACSAINRKRVSPVTTAARSQQHHATAPLHHPSYRSPVQHERHGVRDLTPRSDRRGTRGTLSAPQQGHVLRRTHRSSVQTLAHRAPCPAL
jgi:hypothetical protein